MTRTPSPILTLRDGEFEAEVLRSDSPTPIVVEFGSAWCPPCKALRPVLERLATTYAGRLRVAEIDVNEAPEIVRRFGIRGTPTVLVFQSGQEIARQLGATTRERLLAMCRLG